MTHRFQINVAAGVLRRNKRTGRADPAIIVRDYGDPGHPYRMATRVDFPGGAVVQQAFSVWVEADQVELTGGRAGLDDPQD
jgi:hypothetical protein